MTERRERTHTPDVLPDAIASRLLARASELDALRDDDLAVADLRAAAAEAGISGAPPVTMAVGRDGQLFAALGVAPGPDGRRVGRVELAGAIGSATTPAALEVSDESGEVMFSAPAGGQEVELVVPSTTQRARGHSVRPARDRAGGPLRAEAVTP